MDDVSPTNQQVITLGNALEKESQRVSHWPITCFIFAIAVSVLVAVTESFVFLSVALFAWFLAWNRWLLLGIRVMVTVRNARKKTATKSDVAQSLLLNCHYTCAVKGR